MVAQVFTIPSSYLDTIQTITFHPTKLCLASGGNNDLIKFWRMDIAILTSSVQVQFTFPKHAGTKFILQQITLDSRAQTPANTAWPLGNHHKVDLYSFKACVDLDLGLIGLLNTDLVAPTTVTHNISSI